MKRLIYLIIMFILILLFSHKTDAANVQYHSSLAKPDPAQSLITSPLELKKSIGRDSQGEEWKTF